MPYCVGLDWGSVEHAVGVLDETGKVVLSRAAPHDKAGLATLRKDLARLGPPQDIAIAIERPSGLIVDTLVAAGHPVVPIHPNVVKACRPRYSAAGGKSDRGDAVMLADILRTDGPRFRVLQPASDDIKALQAQTRCRDEMVADRVALVNRLSGLLDSFWPGAARLFCSLDTAIARAFLRRYPTPRAARTLTEKRLAAFLAGQAYSGGKSPAALIARLCASPAGLCGPREAQAKGELVGQLVGLLDALIAQTATLTRRIEEAVAAHPDGRIVMSFPRAGRVCAARILAELGDVRDRFQTSGQLAAEAGVCPVTHASGKRRNVVFRWACNHRLRTAVTCFADNSRHQSRWAAKLYADARKRGCRHPHAIRILARAWIRILWRAWKDRKPYDAEHHAAAKKLAQAIGG
ncbi:MAG: IS110 family transposase [Rhodospirillaceae bacterium]